jgi:putative ABC transport system permease protein
MNWFRQIRNRRHLYNELSEEIDAHLQEKIESLVEHGMSHDEAIKVAHREFGNVSLAKEKSREAWEYPKIESIWFDLRYAARQLRKYPGFSFICVLTIALGIGANAAVFSVVDAVLLDPLPYPNAARLVDIQSLDSQTRQSSAVSYPDFYDWRSQNHTLDQLVSYRPGGFTLTGTDHPVNVDAEVVSWNLLPALGVAPEIGRGFTPDDEKPGVRVALISHELWISQFAGAKAILNRPIHLSGSLFTVVGVMPPSFRFPLTAPQNGIWTTLAVDNDPNVAPPRSFNFLRVLGEMKHAVAIEQVGQDFNTIAASLSKQYPNTNKHHDAVTVQTELAALLGDTRTALFIVQGAVALVLLIACANIANLLLTRMRDREREIAMRTALGANRRRIIRQLLVESLVLGAAGGIVGCALAFASTPLLFSLIGQDIPRAQNASVNLPVLAFATCLTIASALIFGILPSITGSSISLVSSLRAGGQADTLRRDWLRPALIVSQVALGLILTAGAGLLIASFIHLRRTNLGFNPDHLLTFMFVLPDYRYAKTRPTFYREYFDKVRALPGVEAAAGNINLPMTDSESYTPFQESEHPTTESERPSAALATVSTEYFKTMQMPLILGRDFADQDDVKAPPVTIVSREFAKRYFPNQDVIGKKVRPDGMPGESPWREVVGVVGDLRFGVTQREVVPAMYLPATQAIDSCCLYTIIRTRLDPLALEHTVGHLVAAMDPDLPITQSSTMDELVSNQLTQPRFAMVLLGSFAFLALALTVVGLHGVMTYSVSRRTREIGIRMALGAQRTSVLGAIMREATILLGIGIAIGICISLASASVLENMLYGTTPHEPRVFGWVVVVVAASGLIAAYRPALRAVSINPTQALREE